MLVNREVILAGIESSYNSDPTLIPGTHSILVEEPSWANEGLRMVERAPVRANIGMLQHIYAGRLETLTFNVEVKGSGSAGTAPELGPLLRMCGMGETVVPSTSVAYSPASTGHESGYIYYYQDGTLRKLGGCRGNVSGALETGDVGKLSFTITGHPVAPTDTSIVTPSYDSTVPQALVGVPFDIGGYSAVINALNFDLANTVAFPPDISAANGYGEIRITRRDVNGSFDPENVLVATNDYMGDFIAGNTMALDTGVIGGTAGNRWRVQMPVVYYRDVSPADREGVRTLDIPFGATESSGDDEITITFT